MSDRLKLALKIALCDVEAAAELVAMLEEMEARMLDAEARVTALENP